MKIVINAQVVEGKAVSTSKDVKMRRFEYVGTGTRQTIFKSMIDNMIQGSEEKVEIIKSTANQVYIYSKKLNKTHILILKGIA